MTVFARRFDGQPRQSDARGPRTGDWEKTTTTRNEFRATTPQETFAMSLSKSEVVQGPLPTSLQAEAGLENSPAWEQIDVGRYRPRRIRGSFRGRELG